MSRCKFLPLVKSGCKNPLPLRSHGLQMFRFMITFASCIVMGKAQGWGHSQNVEPKFATILSWVPYFANAPTLGLNLMLNGALADLLKDPSFQICNQK
jgi:hypothetical protein